MERERTPVTYWRVVVGGELKEGKCLDGEIHKFRSRILALEFYQAKCQSKKRVQMLCKSGQQWEIINDNKANTEETNEERGTRNNAGRAVHSKESLHAL
jgi:hypothetical protein